MLKPIEPELATELVALSQLLEATLSAADVWQFETLVDCAKYRSAYDFLLQRLATQKYELGPDASRLAKDVAERVAASQR